MQIPAISSAKVPETRTEAAEPQSASPETEKAHEASRQFEAIMLRQFLGESMGKLLQGGPSGNVYGYMLTDTLADSMSKAGGLGMTSIIQAQLGSGAAAGKGAK